MTDSRTFPQAHPSDLQRPRRLRGTAALRDVVAETDLRPRHLIAPYFVVGGTGQEQSVRALPGVSRYSVDRLLRELETDLKLGLRTALLFGVVGAEGKDDTASSADDPAGPVPSALRAARAAFGNDLTLITDVCLCAHTSHGHCGLVRPSGRGPVIDDALSLPRLSAMALAHAEAGADIVSPSDMMDGRVRALREALDGAGFAGVGLLSYAVKYASAFYGPFREAAGSAPAFGDRRTYQMDPRNSREALREAALDEQEGADLLMVKPALAYLDILQRLRPATSLPLVAYSVSGEYAMLRAAAAAGALDEAQAVTETLMSMRRAGADLIVTYHARQAVQQGWLT